MNDRLQTFLRACDRNQYFDLAGQALLLAVAQMTQPSGTIPPIVAKACPRGVNALQKARSGQDLTRADLRALAELEHSLESPDAVSESQSLEKEALWAVLASVSGTLPRAVQARLARSYTESDEESPDNAQSWGLSRLGWYAVAATIGLCAITGLSALPAAIAFNGYAWATALVPLAVGALLVYILYRRA